MRSNPFIAKMCANEPFSSKIQFFSSEALKIFYSNYHHKPHHLSPTPLSTPSYFLMKKIASLQHFLKPSKNAHLLMAYLYVLYIRTKFDILNHDVQGVVEVEFL